MAGARAARASMVKVWECIVAEEAFVDACEVCSPEWIAEFVGVARLDLAQTED